MPRTNQALDDHVRAMKVVANAGGTIPDEWERLVGELARLSSLDHPCRARLISAILDADKTADVEALYAAALAEEAGTVDTARLLNAVRHVVSARLREVASTVAGANYAAIAKQYNEIAERFTSAATAFDPETDAVIVARDATNQQRKQWNEAESWAGELTRLSQPLATAAALAGVPNLDKTEVVLALLCQPTDQHRRQVWTAFTTRDPDRRCGRWSALTSLGVEIRALPADQLGALQPYREPKPIEVRQIPIADGITRAEKFDPEDKDYRPPPIEPRHPRTTLAG